jgi:uncharacterized protein YbbK (DUF523 family)
VIKIAVSACLLGRNVRYDGKNKFANIEKYFHSDTFELTPICPEVEMGLSIPRPPIEIINHGTIKLVQVDDHTIDLTNQMKTWFQTIHQHLSQFSGFILKSKSPSCGKQTTPHHNRNNKSTPSDGMFVHLLKDNFQKPNIIDELQLQNEIHLSRFLDQLTKLS